MHILMRYSDGEKPTSAQGVVDYIGVHLQSNREAGTLPAVEGYLTKGGQVEPMVYSDIWRLVGWSGKGLPPDLLVRNLTQGLDIHGRRLNRSKNLFQAPVELLITMPSELSEALENDPIAAHGILTSMIQEAVDSIEECATRKRSGKGRKAQPDWAPAKILMLAYVHGLNRADEAAPHIHIIIFRPVLNAQGVWQTLDNGQHTQMLSKPGGGRVSGDIRN